MNVWIRKLSHGTVQYFSLPVTSAVEGIIMNMNTCLNTYSLLHTSVSVQKSKAVVENLNKGYQFWMSERAKVECRGPPAVHKGTCQGFIDGVLLVFKLWQKWVKSWRHERYKFWEMVSWKLIPEFLRKTVC